MYVKCIDIRNVGPIKKCRIEPKFDENGNPIPLLLIGPNGSGKTILSSYICDSFIEIGRKFYNNVVVKKDSLYKYISPENIKYNEKYSVAAVKYDDGNNNICYIEKSGEVKIDDFSHDKNGFNDKEILEIKKILNNKMTNSKDVVFPNSTKSDDDYEKYVTPFFESNVICYFPSDRSETPRWLNKESFMTEPEISSRSYTPRERRIFKSLSNPIILETSQQENSVWISDILYQASSNINLDLNGKIIHNGYEDALAYHYFKIKSEIEGILKLILNCDKVELAKNTGNLVNKFSILYSLKGTRKTNRLINISQLSLGQATLFNIFMTIARYAYQNDFLINHDIGDITGVVVIDEIDAHLDTDLQYDTLPKLMAIFPKIQFIITTHSPLFLLGLDKNMPGKYDLVELPTGERISIDRFSEFDKAYSALKETKTYEKEINGIVSKYNTSQIKVFCEGKTDNFHIKRALNKFQENNQYLDLTLDFYEHSNGNDYLGGEKQLKDFIKRLIDANYTQKSIFILDRDAVIPVDLLKNKNANGSIYYENNVFVFKIPVPMRFQNPSEEHYSEITIEHYYDDDIIKKYVNINGVEKRLFLGNEFNKNCLSSDHKLICDKQSYCDKNQIHIISSDKCGVYDIDDDNQVTNLTISKQEFCDLVVANEINNAGYESFSLILDLIKEIKDM